MSRIFSSCLAGSLMTLALASAARAESFTTRIETRPFYGAVVTLEEGVRVFRPLPPDRQVIINPNNTPLSLGFNDTRVYEQSTSHNYYSGTGGGGAGGPAIYGGVAPFWGRGVGNGRGGMGHAPNRGVSGVQVR